MPTPEQTINMRALLRSPHINAFTQSRTMAIWNSLTPKQADDRLTELETIIEAAHVLPLAVPEA